MEAFAEGTMLRSDSEKGVAQPISPGFWPDHARDGKVAADRCYIIHQVMPALVTWNSESTSISSICRTCGAT